MLSPFFRVLLVTVIAFATRPIPAQTTDVKGHWLGTIKAGVSELRLAFHIEAKDGALGGTMDSIDQGARGIALGAVTVEGKTVRIPVPSAMGRVEGVLNEKGDEISGSWMQGMASVPLILKRVTEVPKLQRPQEPKKPYPYNETEVTYENKAQSITLAGTLTTPKNRKTSPAVLLITGSGAQDRDETLMEHKPFLVLADHLTRQGIAVLRVDDRGVGGSTGSVSRSTSLDFAQDVLAGVAFLKTRPEIDPKQIGVLGHSEGGIIGPIAATQSKDIAFVVMLAGTGVPGTEVVGEQAALMARAMGASQEAIDLNREVQKKIFGILKNEPDDNTARMRIAEIAGAVEASRSANPWFRSFLTLDPAVYLKKVMCPVLVLNGELDLQVAAKQNLPVIEKALKEGGNKDFTIKLMPKLNHLFQTAKTGMPDEYGKIEETMSPAVLETIATWILKHTTEKVN